MVRPSRPIRDASSTAVLAPGCTPLDVRADRRRDGFAHIAARWVVAMEQAGETVHVPDLGPVGTDSVLAVHLVDMLTRRWDLSRTAGRPLPGP
ncbi:MAG TPA: hypothetical protein VFW65_14855 [Pseudonocardiaceae bacterium]|nr:hypothetical protein [Pseudonocardiaceae bacterium]